MIKFELTRLNRTDKDSLVAELRRVSELITAHVISRKAFDKHSKVNSTTVLKRFGSWKEALNQAGLGHRYSGRSEFQKRLAQAKSYSDEQMLSELRRVAQKLGTSNYTMEQCNTHSSIHPETIRRRFGSWWAAMNKAGLAISNRGKRYSEDDYFENLLTIWTRYGRQPTYGEMNRPPSKICAKAYEAKWGTWRKALLAFIDKVNADTKEAGLVISRVGINNSENYEISPKQVKNLPQRQEKNQRVISLGLRYDVLNKDRFRCVICGASPATDLQCKLHVDHIIPFSKGGKKIRENLRTLCSNCNIGKTNKEESVR